MLPYMMSPAGRTVHVEMREQLLAIESGGAT